VSKHRDQIIAEAKELVDEEILGAAFAKPRGATTAVAGGGLISSEIGAQWAGKQHRGAESAQIRLGNPGAIAVTPTSLLTLSVGVSFGGQIKDVKEVLTRVPLDEVESLEVKRMGLAGVMEITAGGSSFKLEGKVNDMRELASAFERVRPTT
jgi:hypothetical protein